MCERREADLVWEGLGSQLLDLAVIVYIQCTYCMMLLSVFHELY